MTGKTYISHSDWKEYTKKLAELEEKLNEYKSMNRKFGAVSQALYKSMNRKFGAVSQALSDIRERLDTVESRSAGTSNYTRSLKERLDWLRKKQKTTSERLDKLEDEKEKHWILAEALGKQENRLGKLEGIVETILAVHGVKR